jgi:hypothetical protein
MCCVVSEQTNERHIPDGIKCKPRVGKLVLKNGIIMCQFVDQSIGIWKQPGCSVPHTGPSVAFNVLQIQRTRFITCLYNLAFSPEAPDQLNLGGSFLPLLSRNPAPCTLFRRLYRPTWPNTTGSWINANNGPSKITPGSWNSSSNSVLTIRHEFSVVVRCNRSCSFYF